MPDAVKFSPAMSLICCETMRPTRFEVLDGGEQALEGGVGVGRDIVDDKGWLFMSIQSPGGDAILARLGVEEARILMDALMFNIRILSGQGGSMPTGPLN